MVFTSLKRMSKALGMVGAAAGLTLGVAAPASADSTVTWQHDVSKLCLGWNLDNNDAKMWGCSSYGTAWYESSNSDGSWLMKRNDDRGYCLTAYWDNDVYMEPCTGNDYQRWYEIQTSAGWKLKHKATGRFLDANDSGSSVYLHDENNGRYQLWH
ncbi:hypothetical protein ACFCV8_13940 [Streptomyces sp. NPDC056347]|uniref:RICIN domain-containing protein n=1 Tax=Streptomyces sp. NPDC056347 TaxID=3345790 RepID=UPI0035D5A52F